MIKVVQILILLFIIAKRLQTISSLTNVGLYNLLRYLLYG